VTTVEPTAGVVRLQGDSDVYGRVLAAVRERYAPGLYRASATDDAEIVVRVSRDVEAVYIADTPRHQVLYARLADLFGSDQFRCEPIHETKLEGGDVLRFDIDAEGQNADFVEFGKTLPDFIRSCFPIQAGDCGYEIQLTDLKLQPPATPLMTRWLVVAQLSLFDTRQLASIDSGRFALCSFLGPRADGRVAEPGQKRGRPFDEANGQLLGSLGQLLKDDARERLRRAAASPEHPRLMKMLDLQLLDVARSP
jgi:hypothetical protein